MANPEVVVTGDVLIDHTLLPDGRPTATYSNPLGKMKFETTAMGQLRPLEITLSPKHL